MATVHALKLDPDQQQQIEALASKQLRSPEFVLREAIKAYLEREASENEIVLTSEELAELDARTEHYERTGLHVTHEEVSDWIHRLESDPQAPAPRCHI